MEVPAPEQSEPVAQTEQSVVQPAEQPREVPRTPRSRDDNTVYVGKKGTMGYVLAVVTQFNNGASEVVVKARGKLISRAVDVVEIVRHRFMPNAKIEHIHISTEELTSEDGSMNKVSSIEIKIQK
ncbi:DNA-binding protein Alba [Candidatus Micrarchaeota archaeon]|nr:DNA-binding protein Alba [Candidatus Micrarchaeota archaeon]MBU1681602.1 DNA-binding protein Alba [Candidatus Micrarchaeota archaeon]